MRHHVSRAASQTVGGDTSALTKLWLFPCSILPWSVVWKPSTMRWSICSEELCFFNPFVGAFMGAGRVLPIKRGGSIYQKVRAARGCAPCLAAATHPCPWCSALLLPSGAGRLPEGC